MLRVRLVGELRLELDGQPLAPPASPRARGLLAWLAYHPGLHPRARVASVFWPQVLEESARASLRTTLATLRRDLGAEAAVHVVADRSRLGIVDGPGVCVDVREIDRLARDGRPEDALALADGELLTDLDDDWVLEERRSYDERVGELLVGLGRAAEERDDGDGAVRYARRRLERDPLSEDALRVLMRRLARGGDRAAAVAAFEDFAAGLRRDLGMAPSPETRRTLAEVRSADDHVRTPTAAHPVPDALSASGRGPLVGRREALELLRAAWRAARTDTARAVIVSGEAGSGKTRLLVELAREVRDEGAAVLAGRCPEDAVVAFAPFAEALRPLVAGGTLPGWAEAELARLLPELHPEAAGLEGDPRDARHRLFEAVAAAIADIARTRAVLLVVEDLHWADRASSQMLAHVMRTVGWAPLLVLGSLRDGGGEAAGPAHALLDDLRRQGRLERVPLPGLSERETLELAEEWLGGEGSDPGLGAALHRRTGGNPLFVEELARHLVESRPGGTAEDLAAAAARDVPQGVRWVIDRRLARLPEEAGRAVRMAAVSGDDFAIADLATACDTTLDALAEALEAAVDAGLVDELGVPGHYRFAHALIREAVLAGLPRTRRALLHKRMAEVLEALGEEDRERRLPELARHLLDARPLVAAVAAARVAVRAAEQAVSRLAYEDATELLERAAAASLEGDAGLRGEVLLALGDARLRSGAGPAAERCFADAAGVARDADDGELLARAALGRAGLAARVGPPRDEVRDLLEEALDGVSTGSPLRPRLLARLAVEVYYVPPPARRERLSDEAVTAGRRTGGRALLEALNARHVALWSPVHTEERLVLADELVAAARAQGDREAELQGLNWRVADLFELGELDALRESLDGYERLSADLRLPSYAWFVSLWRASLALLAGRSEEARRISADGERIGLAAHDDNAELLFWVQRNAISAAQGRIPEGSAARHELAARSPAGAAWRVALAHLALLEGERERAAAELEREVARLESAPLDANWLYSATTLGAIAAHLRHGDAAASVYRLLLPFGHRVVPVGRGAYCTGSASLWLGLLAASVQDEPAAVRHLEEAVRRNDALGAVPYAAAARHALGGVLGDGQRAAALRRDAEQAAVAVGMTLPDGVLWRL